jgi:hypothetical protein
MCDICVMNRVKERMLSRRNFFKGTAAMAGRGGGGRRRRAVPLMAEARNGRGHDPQLSEEFPTFSECPVSPMSKQFDFASDGYNLYVLSVNEHTGTHIDAPLHFSADGQSVAEIPVENLVLSALRDRYPRARGGGPGYAGHA